MKKIFTFLLILYATVSFVHAQYWKPTGALAASGSKTYLTGATNVGDKIFAVSLEQNMVYSTDYGKTWKSTPGVNSKGTYAFILGIEDRLYASMKMNAYDTELYYSTDNGATWKPDTVGLPLSPLKTGKSAMLLKYMGNGYVLAHNYLKAYYKKLTETSWKPTTIDFSIVDVGATNNKWLAIGAGKILESTNNGGSWIAIATKGLPAGFQGALIASNGTRVYVANSAALGGETIYFSDDGGINWAQTNSAGHYTYANPWIKNLYVVNQYVFAAVTPKFGNIQDAPPFLISSENQLNFKVGDVSGFPTGKTNTNLPFFFHAGKNLYTMFWDIYAAEPGFTAGPATNSPISEKSAVNFWPNPFNNYIQLTVDNEVDWSVYSLNGTELKAGKSSGTHKIALDNLTSGVYILKINSNSENRAYRIIKQ